MTKQLGSALRLFAPTPEMRYQGEPEQAAEKPIEVPEENAEIGVHHIL